MCKINLCVECQKRTHAGGNRRKHPVTVYHAGKVQEQEEEEMDEETRRRKMAEKVVSFLLVDETEEIQVRATVACLTGEILWFVFLSDE